MAQGTWQFLAAELIQNPRIEHTFCHDLESAFYVLLWIIILYVKNSWNTGERAATIRQVLMPEQYGETGGCGKAAWMSFPGALRNFNVPSNEPLTFLLKSYKNTLSVLYNKPEALDTMPDPPSEGSQFTNSTSESRLSQLLLEDRNKCLSRLKDHTYILELFRSQLEDASKWPVDDCAKLQDVSTSISQQASINSSSKRSRESELQEAFVDDSSSAQKWRRVQS